MDSILKILFALVIPLCPCFAGTPTAEESKACYGAAGIKCTTHNLKCTDGRISIQEAFYEKNNKCPTVGTDCADFNISNISLSGETTNFSSTELKSLCRICSMNSTCRLPPVRSTGSGLSVIIYQCITGNGRPDRVCNSILKETTAAATTLKSSTVNENETPEVEEGTTHSGWSTDHTTKHKFPNQTTLRSTTANTNRTTATATATATATQEPTAALSSQTLSGSSSIFPSDKTTQTENGTETALTTSPISNNDTGDSKQQDEVSKACYGSPGTPCVSHTLKCSSGRIAIKEAFYTNSTACGYGVVDCDNINITGIQLTGIIYYFNDTELDSLYGNCSTQSECSLRPGRRGTMGNISFSAIRYECISETIHTCNFTNIQGNDTSLIWRGPSDQKTCWCSISKTATNESTALTLTSLEMRPHYQAFHIYVDGNTLSIQFKNFTLKQVIFNSTTWEEVMMTVFPANNKSVIWIEIKASDNINIVCNENTTTGAAGATTSLKTTSSKTSPATSTQGTTRSLTSITSSGPASVVSPDQTTKTETATEGKHTTGTVVGIIIPICIIIAGVVTAVIIYRRRKIRQKGENWNVAKPKSIPQEVLSLEKKSSPDYDYTTTNGHLHVVSKEHNIPAPRKASSRNDYAEENTNHEVKPQQLSSTSDYDYATCGDQQANRDHPTSRNPQTQDSDYDHIGHQPARGNGHRDTTGKGSNDHEEVYSYNHLNEKASVNVDANPTYNTTASTRHKMNASTNMEDDYGYNHLGTESKKNLPQNEYDTTASAIRDLARMNGDMEDSTYDHAHLKTSDCSSSGIANVGFNESDYDHVSSTTAVHKDEYKSNASPNENPKEDGKSDVYTIAQDIDSNPYQLAK